VKTGAEGAGPSIDAIEIDEPDDLGDIAHLGLSLAEAKLLLAGVQRQIVAAQARSYVIRRRIVDAAGVFAGSRATGITRQSRSSVR
jgi:hypothetical protein